MSPGLLQLTDSVLTTTSREASGGGLQLVPGVNLYRLRCAITSHCTLMRLYTGILGVHLHILSY